MFWLPSSFISFHSQHQLPPGLWSLFWQVWNAISSSFVAYQYLHLQANKSEVPGWLPGMRVHQKTWANQKDVGGGDLTTTLIPLAAFVHRTYQYLPSFIPKVARLKIMESLITWYLTLRDAGSTPSRPRRTRLSGGTMVFSTSGSWPRDRYQQKP